MRGYRPSAKPPARFPGDAAQIEGTKSSNAGRPPALSSFRGASKAREPGIHNHDREYGFRARAKWRVPE
jgi:hypothetical protein